MEDLQLSQEYNRKRITPEQAAGLVQSGMSIFLGIGANMASIIDKHLAARKNELRDVSIQTSLDTLEHEFLKADPQGEVFKWNSGFFLHSVRRQLAERGSGIYWAQSWHLAPGVIREQSTKDIAFIVTAPMDAHGNFNFGLSVTELMAFCEVSKKVVVIVREDMPVVCGGQEEAIHISKVDHIVEDREYKTFCLPAVPAKEEDRWIARNIVSAGLIRDGATLQIGIGGLPNSVLEALADAGAQHLGIHSEMLTDKMFDLIQAGVVDNTCKKIDRYKSTFAFCLGSRRLYDFIDHNPMFASYPVDYVNNPLVIAQQPRMFSLNTTMQVDLVGQVASEQIGGDRPRQISGTGGQLDFVMGTMLSQDRQGASVLALYSQYKGRSRIVPVLEKGTVVTVPRSIVDYIATEWGVIKSRGLSISDRAQALIRIAHPAHRDTLMRQAVDAGFIAYRAGQSNQLPKGVIMARDE